jgi:hypothetical protein
VVGTQQPSSVGLIFPTKSRIAALAVRSTLAVNPPLKVLQSPTVLTQHHRHLLPTRPTAVRSARTGESVPMVGSSSAAGTETGNPFNTVPMAENVLMVLALALHALLPLHLDPTRAGTARPTWIGDRVQLTGLVSTNALTPIHGSLSRHVLMAASALNRVVEVLVLSAQEVVQVGTTREQSMLVDHASLVPIGVSVILWIIASGLSADGMVNGKARTTVRQVRFVLMTVLERTTAFVVSNDITLPIISFV